MSPDEMKLHAARYAFHRLVVHRYAVDVIKGAPLGLANEKYAEAMRNYDGIVAQAPAGHSFKGNDADMAIGAGRIAEEVEKFKQRGAA